MTKDTARDPERLEDETDASQETDKADNNTDETKSSEDESDPIEDGEGTEEDEVLSSEEIAAELYKGNIVKYLLVPEDAEIPVGLDNEMIIVNLPVDKTYVSSGDALETMNTLDLFANISTVGFEKEDCEQEDIVSAMEAEEIIFAGEYTDPDYKELVKEKTNFAILPSDILPMDEEALKAVAEDDKKTDSKESAEEESDEEALTVEEQTERLEEIAEKFAMLDIPMIVDRSADEKTDLAKYEWIKVYGVLFGEEQKAVALFDEAVKAAE